MYFECSDHIFPYRFVNPNNADSSPMGGLQSEKEKRAIRFQLYFSFQKEQKMTMAESISNFPAKTSSRVSSGFSLSDFDDAALKGTNAIQLNLLLGTAPQIKAKFDKDY